MSTALAAFGTLDLAVAFAFVTFMELLVGSAGVLVLQLFRFLHGQLSLLVFEQISNSWKIQTSNSLRDFSITLNLVC